MAAQPSYWKRHYPLGSVTHTDPVRSPISICGRRNMVRSRSMRPNCINRRENSLCGWQLWTLPRESFVQPCMYQQLLLCHKCRHFRAHEVLNRNSCHRTGHIFHRLFATEPAFSIDDMELIQSIGEQSLLRWLVEEFFSELHFGW